MSARTRGMGWIKVDKDLPSDPRVLAIADAYLSYWRTEAGLTEDQVEILRPSARHQALGAVVTLWSWIDTHLDHADTIKCVTQQLSDVTQIPLPILLKWPLEWLQDNGDGTLKAPHYSDKNALLDKESRREQTRRRVRNWRERQRRHKVTLEKRKSNNSERHSNASTGTGTETIRDRDRDRDEERAARRGASAPTAPAPRAPEVPRPASADGSTWVSWTAPAGERSGNFDDEFRRRFGVTPDEAHEMRQPKKEPPEEKQS